MARGKLMDTALAQVPGRMHPAAPAGSVAVVRREIWSTATSFNPLRSWPKGRMPAGRVSSVDANKQLPHFGIAAPAMFHRHARRTQIDPHPRALAPMHSNRPANSDWAQRPQRGDADSETVETPPACVRSARRGSRW